MAEEINTGEDIYIDQEIKIKETATLQDIIWLLNKVGLYCYGKETLEEIRANPNLELKKREIDLK